MRMMTMGKGAVDIQDTPLVLTCTTTGAATLTIYDLTVATDKTVTVDWGDTTSNAYTGTGQRTHAYAGAGVWTVKLANRRNITKLDLRDTKLSGTINGTNPLPAGLTTLTLYNLAGLTYNANTNPLPSGLTSLTLYNLAGLTYNANTNPLPAGLTTLALYTLAGLTYNANTNPLPAGLTYLALSTLAGLTYNANTNPLPAGLTYLYLNSLAGLTYNANTNPLPAGLTSLTLSTLAGLTYNANTNPLPAGLTYLTLYNLAGLTYNANTNPLPAGLTTLALNTLAGLTWEIKSGAAWPTGETGAVITVCPNITCTEWTDNAIRSIRAENAYSQANVDAFINAIWANKANFTYAAPSLDLLGGSNLAPSGVYQAANPPTTGLEKLYDLVNGNYTPAGPEWTVQYQV